MNEWMDGWMDRWMDGWMDGWMDRWMDGWMDGWVNARVDGWMWMDKQNRKIHLITVTKITIHCTSVVPKSHELQYYKNTF